MPQELLRPIVASVSKFFPFSKIRQHIFEKPSVIDLWEYSELVESKNTDISLLLVTWEKQMHINDCLTDYVSSFFS